MRMPDLATVDATVTIVGWLKEVGQQVKRGEPLLEVETDKAILPVESPVVGVLSEITAAAGAEVATGQIIARLSVVDDDGRLEPRRRARKSRRARCRQLPTRSPHSHRIRSNSRRKQARPAGDATDAASFDLRAQSPGGARRHTSAPVGAESIVEVLQARFPQVSLRADGLDSRVRGRRQVPVPGGLDARHDSSVPGPGGDRRRRLCGPAKRATSSPRRSAATATPSPRA